MNEYVIEYQRSMTLSNMEDDLSVQDILDIAKGSLHDQSAMWNIKVTYPGGRSATYVLR